MHHVSTLYDIRVHEGAGSDTHVSIPIRVVEYLGMMLPIASLYGLFH
jgi:hypothetical protein